MGVYSYSKLDTFEKCKLKYKYKYIDKIIPKIPKNIEAHLGSCVHETLEWLYKQVLNGDVPLINEVIEDYSERWIKNYTPDIVINSPNLKLEDYFNKGIEFLLKYYLKHKPFNDNTLFLEEKIELDLLDKETNSENKIIGYVDRISFNEKNNEIEIHDYKTSSTMFQKEMTETSKQLAIYSMAAKKIFGEDKNVCLIWHFLAYDNEIVIRKNKEELERIKEELIELIKEIENTKNFPPNPSKLCNWCEYKDICPYSGLVY
jgi:putative RecB family exonuclease